MLDVGCWLLLFPSPGVYLCLSLSLCLSLGVAFAGVRYLRVPGRNFEAQLLLSQFGSLTSAPQVRACYLRARACVCVIFVSICPVNRLINEQTSVVAGMKRHAFYAHVWVSLACVGLLG